MNKKTEYTIKCVFNLGKNHSNQQSVENFEKTIVTALSDLPQNIGYSVLKKLEQNNSNATDLELVTTLKVADGMADTVSDAVFFSLSHLLQKSENLPVSFFIVEDDFFDDKFECRDEKIEVNSISFGIIDSTMKFIASELDPSMYQEHANHFHKWPPAWKHFMKPKNKLVFQLDLLHDKNQLILRLPMIDYGEKERNRRRKANGNNNRSLIDSRGSNQEQIGPYGNRSYFNEIEIKLLYENIQKITVDITEASEKDSFLVADFYFNYRNCPLVFIQPIYQDKEFAGRSFRYIEWSDDFTIKNFLEDMGQSSVMIVKVHIHKNQFSRVIYQLQFLMNSKIPYKRYISAPLPEFPAIPNMFYNWPFEIRYMIDAIFSIGYIGKYRLMKDKSEMEKFVRNVDKKIKEGQKKEVNEILHRKFYEIIQDSKIIDGNFQIPEKSRIKGDLEDDYENIRKVVITPTRVLLFPPEPMMGSRIVRKIGADRILRVVFRDDSMSTMSEINCPQHIINTSVAYFLKNRLKIGGEQYYFLGYSNSQLRDHGCYFLRTDNQQEPVRILQSMGNFKTEEGVAKTMARFAQCFTQSRRSKTKLDPGNSDEISDFQSCAQDSNGKHYCFSDGVGLISQKTAKKLIKDLKIDPKNTTCFQFRSGGYKGVLSVDPFLDFQQKWLKNNNINYPKNKLMKCDVLFRTSQNKFTATEEEQEFEVVKHSTAVPLRLNKPLINIYDQVSEKQSPQCGARIRKRITELTNEHITNVIQSLTTDTAFRDALLDIPVYAPINQLLSYSTLVDEPFFHSMVVARAKASLKLLNEKKQIKIPPEYGRTMFGIVDPYGILQYGQVFVQYSNSISTQSVYNDLTTILKGPVAISKNPMCNSGDLRMYEAIDVPALRHIVNNVVFPQSGPRPHPDEMAGSDLDGDEYSLIWDPELFLERNEPAFNYTPDRPKIEEVPINELLQKSADFFVDYIMGGMIGQIANAHLENADLYGLDSGICLEIAKKQMTAVDFAKTGHPAEPLTRVWNGDLPPERAERHPDFMNKDHLSIYESPRLLGDIHRTISKFYNVMSTVMNQGDEKPDLDKCIDVPGWELYRNEAAAMYKEYMEELDHLVVAYGILNEGELFSQHFTVLTQRFNNRENDNMSAFTTASFIQAQVFKIFTQYRIKFFEKFEFRFSSTESKEIIREKVEATETIKQFAVACYTVAYENGKYLSFPWIAWDVIDQVRMDKRIPPNMDALGSLVSKEIYRKEFSGFKKMEQNFAKFCPAVLPYLHRYDELGKLLYFVIKWKEQQHFLDMINKVSICLLFIKFGLGDLPCPKGFYPFLKETNNFNKHEKVTLENPACGIGRKLIWFFASLGSNEFADLTDFDYTTPNLGPNNARYNRESWIHLHEAGLGTLLNIACKIRPEVLLPFNPDGSSEKNSTQIMKNPTSFVVEVPRDMCDDFIKCLPEVKEQSGCVHIAYHVQKRSFRDAKNNNPNSKITLWARGTPTQIQKFRGMFIVRPKLHPNEPPIETSTRIGTMVMNKIKEILKSPDANSNDYFLNYRNVDSNLEFDYCYN